ncbi:MAG: acyltransferase domain-containing protein, partial [Thiolinea sp.]
TDCAVYVGIASTDYLNRRVDDPASMDAYTMTGNTASIASNRISYIYDLHGPSVSVDTACSSSLVAVHHACQSIRSGEASMAIAGGVNMLLHPFAFVGFSQASMLSERGRCRTFDADGDGYVRAEGAAVLFLKPLSQAEADGDPIHGVIVASGINSDGRTNGLTVPSANQQGNLLRKVYAQAGVNVDDLVYLEAHGTGTAVGDPIETKAIGEVLGQQRSPDNPLLIGSAKSNLGHLETASGMAGLIKAVLTLQQQQIPPSLHVETLNPAIEFARHNLRVVTEPTSIKSVGERQLVGVNSFGFGGANAHVLIEHYGKCTAPEFSKNTDAQCFPPLFLSAQNQNALNAMAAQYADWLSDEQNNYYDIAWSASQHRQHLQEGLVISVESREQLCTDLVSFAEDKAPGTVSTDTLIENDAGLTLVFSGNGSQWQGMGQQLLTACSDFKAAVLEVNELLSAYINYSLLDEFAASENDSRLQLTEIAQPLLFAYQVAVVRVLEKQGVHFDTVIGHSVGEVAAAWASGALSLEQAVRVIYERSQAQAKTAGLGRMAAAGLGPDGIPKKLAHLGLSDKIEIAGINSPQSVTLSGALADLEALGGLLESEGTFFRILELDYAFHSRRMEPVKSELLTALADLVPQAEDRGIRFVSTVNGDDLLAAELSANYWWDNIRQPVLFADGVNKLLDDGVKVWLEVGPHAILRNYINECQREKNIQGRIITTGLRNKEQANILNKAAHAVWLAGCGLDWSVHFPVPGNFVAPPAYPWQRERYWYPLTADGYDLVNRRREHPILGYRLRDAEAMWENQIDMVSLSFLADHIVDGAVIVPAAAYVEMALAAASIWYRTDTQVIENFEIRAPVMLEEGRCKSIRLNLDPGDGGFTISSRERQSEDAWTLNVVGRLTGAVLKASTDIVFTGLAEHKANADEVISATEHYRLTESVGLSYLAAFQSVSNVWVSEEGALAELNLAESLEADQHRYLLHPALLDGAFQVLVDVFRESIRNGQPMALIPIQIGKLNLFNSLAGIRYLQLKVRKKSPRSVVADFLLLDQDEQVVGELLSCRFRGVHFSRQTDKTPGVYEFVTRLKPGAADQRPAPPLDLPAIAAKVQSVLQAHEHELQRQLHHEQIAPLLEVLATRYAWDALSILTKQLPAAFKLSDLLQQNRIAVVYQPLLHRMLDILSDSGLAVNTEGSDWSLAEACDLPAAQDIWLSILGDSPAHLPELVMMGRCGENLPAVLRGEISTRELLTPAKSSIRDHWLDSAPGFRAANLALSAWVQSAVENWPVHRRIRILELGAGNGALALRLLPVLPAERCDYVFSDPDNAKVEQAVIEFEEYDFFQAQQLDTELNGDGYLQLMNEPGFDLVIVANALYEWGDISVTLTRLRALLRAQGVLLMADLADSHFLDLTCGLDANWWYALDGNEAEYLSRLPTSAEWDEALVASGFDKPSLLTEPEQNHGLLRLALADGNEYPFSDSAEQQAEELAVMPETVSSTLTIESWLIVTGQDGHAVELALLIERELKQRGFVAAIQEDFSLTQHYDHIVHMAGLSLSPVADAMSLQEQRCIATVNLVQELERRKGGDTRLWLITSGAVPAGIAGGVLHPEQAP